MTSRPWSLIHRENIFASYSYIFGTEYFLGTDYTDYTDFLSENKGASLRVIRVIRALFFFSVPYFFLRAYLIAFPI